MNEDIVTRLRNWHDQRDSWSTLNEAAEEIEHLRAAHGHIWRVFCHYWFYQHGMFDKCPLCDMVSKTLNDMVESQRPEVES
jgi:hypothetical protein